MENCTCESLFSMTIYFWINSVLVFLVRVRVRARGRVIHGKWRKCSLIFHGRKHLA